MVRRISILAALLFCFGTLNAQQSVDSMRLYFRRGYSTLEYTLRGNRSSLDELLRALQAARSDSLEAGTIRLHLLGSASPDGTYRANQRLSEKRMHAVLDLLHERAALPDSLITAEAVGIDWEGLAGWIEGHAECPARAELLEIIRHTPLLIRDAQGRIVDGRTRQLMGLQGGRPYNYLLEHCFPELRNATLYLYRPAFAAAAEKPEGASADGAEGADGVGAAGAGEGAGTTGADDGAAGSAGVADAAEGTGAAGGAGRAGAAGSAGAAGIAEEAAAEGAAAAAGTGTAGETGTAGDAADAAGSAGTAEADGSAAAAVGSAVAGTVGTAGTVAETAAAGETAAESEPLHRLAIKTNLLYDAILMPSLEVEYRIDDRWSVAVEGDVAWWKRDSRHKYYQIATILPEGRYWFRTKKPWHGHYVGLFAGGSWYDLENGGRGYKGEFWTVGISYGYMFPIGRRWSLEAGLGVGFLRTRYEEYLPIEGHYVYQQTSRTNWLGPVKLKFALVYRLWDINRKGGRK